MSIRSFSLRNTIVAVLIVFLQSGLFNLNAQTRVYKGQYIDHIAFPIGGIGAGMFCMEGTGALSHMSVRNKPEMFNEPAMFAAIALKGVAGSARVLEGPVPDWKKFGQIDAARGAEGTTYGLARFKEASFKAKFPFCEVELKDSDIPVKVTITGWSPFIPTDADNSSLPVGMLEYRFTNSGSKVQRYVFSYNSKNFMALPEDAYPKSNIGANHINSVKNGFLLCQDGTDKYPEHNGTFAVWADEPVIVDHCWFRGAWYDPLTMAWSKIENMDTASVSPVDHNAPGASLYINFSLKPGESKNIKILMAWYAPNSLLRFGDPVIKTSDSIVKDRSKNFSSLYYKPWYSSKFKNIKEVVDYWQSNYRLLENNTKLFSNAFYQSSLPAAVMEAVSSNLSILKSPTVLRQYDGRFWAWEGCNDNEGSCAGSCTHVWNYAQALPHLFPSLERSLRETEFAESQNAEGHQQFRTALPIRPEDHNFYAASDGQLGGIMKVYREWRICGDSNWLIGIYPNVKKSLDYCIRTWDPRHLGMLEEPHHNTYDIEFWGPDAMCTGFYLGALNALIKMGKYLHEDTDIYQELFEKGKHFLEKELYNGNYFIQKIKWKGLNAPNPIELSKQIQDGGGLYSPEAEELLQKEGPKYQYGNGCLSDGMIGIWMARVCGIPDIIDTAKVKSHLTSVYRYNEKKDLSNYSNPQRPSFALGKEGGLLLCTWPKGGKLSLPFVYSNEVWTGIEYEVASHLIFTGEVEKGLDIVRTARSRYNGKVRNPFDEYECGHWYARAMSSYALLEAFTGVRYDAVEKTLYINSKMAEFTSFLSTATGFGDVVYKNGKVKVNIVYGNIDIQHIVITKKK